MRTDVDACDSTRGLYGTDAVRESDALEVYSERKIPCRNGDSNKRQYCAWLFSRTFYQLSYFSLSVAFDVLRQIIMAIKHRLTRL